MPILAFAQPHCGIKIGANTTFVKDTEYFNYQSRFGFDLGYQQVFALNTKLILTTGLMFNRYSLSVSDGGLFSIGTKNIDNTFISIPLAFNYVINKSFLFGGYQYGYKLWAGSPRMPVNEHNHSLIAGVGYSIKAIDLSLQYIHTLNQENLEMRHYNFDGANRPDKALRLQTIQLSLTIPLGKRKK